MSDGSADEYSPHDLSCATSKSTTSSGKCEEYKSYYEDDITSEQSYVMDMLQPDSESVTPDAVSGDEGFSYAGHRDGC